jgi:hypothetical protein
MYIESSLKGADPYLIYTYLRFLNTPVCQTHKPQRREKNFFLMICGIKGASVTDVVSWFGQEWARQLAWRIQGSK